MELRWQVEQHLRDLKQTMKMDVLRCKSVDGVLKELMVYAIVYNLVRLVMKEAARRQRVAVERISFIDALRGCWKCSPASRCRVWWSTRCVRDALSRACGSDVPRSTR